MPPLLSTCRRLGLLAAVCAFAGATAGAETLTLDDCLRAAVENNPLIAGQRLEIEAAAGRKLVLRSRALPDFSIGGDIGEQGKQTTQVLAIPAVRKGGQVVQPAFTVRAPRPSLVFAIGTEALNQPVFDAAIPASWRRGRIEVAAAKANFAVVASSQLDATRTSFCRALYFQEYSKTLDELAGSLNANVDAANGLIKAGLAGRQTLLAAQIQVANWRPAQLDAEANYKISLAQLLQAMGRSQDAGTDPASSITLAGTLGGNLFTFDAAAMAREALARRPDLLALREAVASLAEDAHIAAGGYWPVVRIYVDGQLLPSDFVRGNAQRPGDNTQTSEARPGIRENWAVIDTGAVRGDVRRIEALRDASAIALRQAERNIPSELALVRAQLTSAGKQSELFASNVAIAQDTQTMTEASVKQGTLSQLDFLNAQQGVLGAKIGALQAQLQVSLASAEFTRITGGYLRFVQDDATIASPATK
jgi:outer membrane protein TolC